MRTTTQIYVPARSLGCACVSREARDAFADDCTLASDGTLVGSRDTTVDEEHEVLIDREHMLQYDIDMEIEER